MGREYEKICFTDKKKALLHLLKPCNDRFLVNLLTCRDYLSAFNKRFSSAFMLTTELARSPRSRLSQFRYIANLCEVLVTSMICQHTSHVCDRSMTFTVSYGAYLQNAVDRVVTASVTRFSLLKIKQLRDVCLLFRRFYLLRVSASRRSPKRMQLSPFFWNWLLFLLDFNLFDFLMIRISAFPVFRISGFHDFRFTYQLQSPLNGRFNNSRLQHLNLNFMTQNETCLVDFRFSSKLSPLDSCFIELFTVNPLLSPPPPPRIIFFEHF